MDQALVRALRARNVDVLTAQEAAMIERSDAEHLAFAAAQGRTLCTFNVADFWILHGEYLASARSHAGVVLMPQQRFSVGELLRRLLRLVTSLAPDVMTNRAEFLSAWDPLG